MRIAFTFPMLLAGCSVVRVLVDFVPTNPSPRPMQPKPPNEVLIVSTPPKRPFAEVGFIDGQSNGSQVGPAETLGEMQSAAGRIGCDVLLITGANNMVSGFRGSSYTEPGYHGACLVFTDTPVAAPQPKSSSQATPAAQAKSPALPPVLLFRSAKGNVYRVQPESRDEALRAGWIPIGRE